MKSVLEELAKLEHIQWEKWATNLMENEKLSDKRVNRWKEYIKDYSLLPEMVKEFDREWARKVLAIVKKNQVIFCECCGMPFNVLKETSQCEVCGEFVCKDCGNFVNGKLMCFDCDETKKIGE